MNLFWETRQLTESREDHLTCFIAAALETDATFRAANADIVLAPLAAGEHVPQIAAVSTQESFPEQRSRPDMMLTLQDGRRVAVEHKIEASQTVLDVEEGEPSEQLERYLALPGVDAVAYFRATLKAPADHVLSHPRYLRPANAAHFLWRDLFSPLTASEQPLSTWLRAGFERLGFTPPLLHLGELGSKDGGAGQLARENFGKLWHSVRGQLSDYWRSERGTAATLYLEPSTASPVEYIFLNPGAQGGTLLRARVRLIADQGDTSLIEVRRRLESVIPLLPAPTEMISGVLPSGQRVVDLDASLFLILGDAPTVEAQEEHLLAHVAPIARALEFSGVSDPQSTPSQPHVPARRSRGGASERRAHSRDLWRSTREQLADHWSAERGARANLYLVPKRSLPIDYIFLRPGVPSPQQLSIRVRIKKDSAPSREADVQRCLEAMAPHLPAPADVMRVALGKGQIGFDLVASLGVDLTNGSDSATNAQTLLAQVLPVAEALDAMV